MSDVIREFLVGLGFKIDATSEKKFVEGIKKASEHAVALGAAMQVAAATISAAVVKIARDMDQMVYASQRLGSSAKDINALTYAVRQMGGSAQGAMSSMEGVARFMRDNPGGKGFIRHLVGEKVDIKDTAAVMNALAVSFRKMDYPLAKARAEAIGIDESTLMAMLRGLDKFSNEYKRKVAAAGIDQDRLAKDSQAFSSAWESMWQSVLIARDKIVATLMPQIAKGIRSFTEWIDRNYAKIASVISGIAKGVLYAAEQIRDVIANFGKMDPAVQALIVTLGALAGVVLALAAPIMTIGALGAAIAALYVDYKAWKAGSEHFIDWDKWEPTIKAAQSALESLGNWLKWLWERTKDVWGVLVEFGKFLALPMVLQMRMAAAAISGVVEILKLLEPIISPLIKLFNAWMEVQAKWAEKFISALKLAYEYMKKINDFFYGDASSGGLPSSVFGQGSASEEVGGKAQSWIGRKWAARPKWLGGTGGDSSEISKAPGFKAKAPGIMTRLMSDFNLTKEQAAGVVGNLGHESVGFRQLQEQKPLIPGSRGGFGWAQWTGARRRDFEAWAKANNLDPRSDEANYGFLKHELETNHRSAIEAVKKAQTPEEAMVAFERTYERAGIKHWASRRSYTAAAMSAFQAAPPTSSKRKGFWETMGDMARGALAPTSAATGSGQAARPAIVDGVEAAKRAFDPKRFDFAPALGGFPSMSSGNQTTLHQKTEINVMGGADPATTASYVERAQSGVNQNMMRNFTSQVR